MPKGDKIYGAEFELNGITLEVYSDNVQDLKGRVKMLVAEFIDINLPVKTELDG